MLFFLAIVFFLFPIGSKFLSIIKNDKKNINSLHTFYLFFAILNILISIFTSTNYANFSFYSTYIMFLTLTIIIIYASLLSAKIVVVHKSKNKYTLDLNKNSYLWKSIKELIYRMWPFFLASFAFIMVLLFYKLPGWDEGAYIMISNNFKNNLFSFGNIYNGPSSYFTSILPYQYSGIYFAYSVWSLQNSSVQFYTILSPITYWIIVGTIINDLSFIFMQKRQKYYWLVSLFINLIFIITTIVNFNLLRSGNNSIFELVTIFTAYELITFKNKQIYGLRCYLPFLAIPFFSPTGYLFLLPASLTFFVSSVVKRDTKRITLNFFVVIFSCFISLFLYKQLWIGFILSILFFSIILNFFLYNIWRNTLLAQNIDINIRIHLFRWIHYWCYSASKIQNNKKHLFYVLMALFLCVVYVVCLYLASGLHILLILFFAILTIEFFIFSLKNKDNINQLYYCHFTYIASLFGSFYCAAVGIISNNAPSFYRTLFFLQGYSNSFAPVILIIFITLFNFINAKYPIINIKNKRLHLSKICKYSSLSFSLASLSLAWIIKGPAWSRIISTSFSSDIYVNLNMLPQKDIELLNKIMTIRDNDSFPTLFTDAPSQFYFEYPFVNSTDRLMRRNLNTQEYFDIVGNDHVIGTWYYLLRTINTSRMYDNNDVILKNIANRITYIALRYYNEIDFLVLDRRSSYYQYINKNVIYWNFDLVKGTESIDIFINKINV